MRGVEETGEVARSANCDTQAGSAITDAVLTVRESSSEQFNYNYLLQSTLLTHCSSATARD